MLAWETWGYECREIREVHQRLQRTDDAVVRLASFDDREQEQFCDLARALPDSIFVMDESSAFLKPSLRNCWSGLFHLTNHGRHHGQAVVLLAQHYAAVPVEFRNQAYMFSSNIAEGVGQDWLKRRSGVAPEEIPEYHWRVLAPDGGVGSMDPVPMETVT